MTVKFVVKCGLNEVYLPINGGVTLRFVVKCGLNVVAIPTTNQVLFFVVKCGENVLEIPEEPTEEKTSGFGTNLFKSKVTIFNDILSDGVNPRRFEKHVIELCNVQRGMLQNADGTIEKVVNALSVITKDTKNYKTYSDYVYLPAAEREKYFTANINDFVVLSEVDDVVTTIDEFRALQKKYKNNGFSVTAVNEYLYGMNVDNVQIIHA